MPNKFKHNKKNKYRRYPFKRQLKRKIRRIIYMVVAAAIATGVNYYNKHKSQNNSSDSTTYSQQSKPSQNHQQSIIQRIRDAKKNTDARFWLEVQASVKKILKDDKKGVEHQKFVISLAPDVSLLVAHNTDLASRVPVKMGDTLTLRGRYEWNNRGGVIHWTHHDPKGRKQGGWIKLNGKTYQ